MQKLDFWGWFSLFIGKSLFKMAGRLDIFLFDSLDDFMTSELISSLKFSCNLLSVHHKSLGNLKIGICKVSRVGQEVQLKVFMHLPLLQPFFLSHVPVQNSHEIIVSPKYRFCCGPATWSSRSSMQLFKRLHRPPMLQKMALHKQVPHLNLLVFHIVRHRCPRPTSVVCFSALALSSLIEHLHQISTSTAAGSSTRNYIHILGNQFTAKHFEGVLEVTLCARPLRQQCQISISFGISFLLMHCP